MEERVNLHVMALILTNASTGFTLALKSLSPSLLPKEKSWGQPGDSQGQILRSLGQMNNTLLDKILDWSELYGVAVHS